jgi:hypothetical protein
MHRNIQVVLGGAALSLGVVVGLPAAAMASSTPDCTNAQIAAQYPNVCVPQPQPIRDNVTAPGEGGTTGGGTTGGGTTGGGTTGGGTSGGSTSGGTVSSGRGAVASLPFTGDEILVLSLAGAAALAAGTALTVAGRRRGMTTA